MKTAYEQGRLVLLQNLDPSLSSSEVQRMGDCLNKLGMEDLKLLEEEMDKAAKVVHERKLMFFGVFYKIWNHEKAILLNSFDNHDFPDEGIPKLCLVNELNDSLLLDASSDGNIQIWKDYTLKGKQKLVTAFSLIHGHKPGMRSLNAVVDWQQQCGYLAMFDIHSHHSITTSIDYGTPGDVLATKFGWLVVLGLAVYQHHIPYGIRVAYIICNIGV
ncbi:hypothetical protein JHK87_031428 [Glycine soja]|nr:hypothetical protein JHK87_031428 [Glycine soja]